jgi:dTDP-4-dehydrorhamnose reductase
VRVLVTGGAGFVGSNVVAVAAGLGHDVVATARELPPSPDPRCRYVAVDLLDRDAVAAAVADVRPAVIVHTAIWNDFAGIYADRRRGWDAYVGTTQTLADAANDSGAALATISSDWVFDGTQTMAGETAPPNPINYYGVLKAASELVTLERAADPIVARIAGVVGVHRAGKETPRKQDAGFGYLVDAVVSALEAGEPFTVWEDERINNVATPTLATLAADWVFALAERGERGIFHCCAAEPVTRLELAQRAAAVFDLDASLVRAGPPIEAELPGGPVPYDTSLDSTATAHAVGEPAPTVDQLLEQFRSERARA